MRPREKLRWTYQAMSPVNAAPVVADGRLFAATEGGQVVALDAATGAELWTITTEGTGLQSLTGGGRRTLPGVGPGRFDGH